MIHKHHIIAYNQSLHQRKKFMKHRIQHIASTNKGRTQNASSDNGTETKNTSHRLPVHPGRVRRYHLLPVAHLACNRSMQPTNTSSQWDTQYRTAARLPTITVHVGHGAHRYQTHPAKDAVRTTNTEQATYTSRQWHTGNRIPHKGNKHTKAECRYTRCSQFAPSMETAHRH